MRRKADNRRNGEGDGGKRQSAKEIAAAAWRRGPQRAGRGSGLGRWRCQQRRHGAGGRPGPPRGLQAIVCARRRPAAERDILVTLWSRPRRPRSSHLQRPGRSCGAASLPLRRAADLGRPEHQAWLSTGQGRRLARESARARPRARAVAAGVHAAPLGQWAISACKHGPPWSARAHALTHMCALTHARAHGHTRACHTF